jgi:hypothetical protein
MEKRALQFFERQLVGGLKTDFPLVRVNIVFQYSIPDSVFEGELQRDLQLSQVLKIVEENNVHFKLEGNKLVILK